MIGDKPNALEDLEGVVKNAIGSLLEIAGIILFVILLFGGFQLLTAGGDPKKAASARNIITYAVIGIIIAASAYLILNFLGIITGVGNLTEFKIKM